MTEQLASSECNVEHEERGASGDHLRNLNLEKESISQDEVIGDGSGDFNENRSNDKEYVTDSQLLQQPTYSKEDISADSHQLIEEVNAKRKHDTKLLEEFKNALDTQAKHTYEKAEHRVFNLYETEGTVIQEKMTDLYTILERITKLEAELENFKASLGMFYHAVAQPSQHE